MAVPRNELKYYLDLAYIPMLYSRLSAVMQMDRHTLQNGDYRIRSLYFEDPRFSSYYDKLNGLENRVKYRLRFYNSDLSYIRLEKKQKQNRMCLKDFEVISPDLAHNLLSPNPSDCGEGLYREMCAKIRYDSFSPFLFVDYRRSAFLHPAGNVRITLDRDVSVSRFLKDLNDDLPPVPVLEEKTAVLEIKFDNYLPPYLSRLFDDIPKISASVSKFCLCARALY